MFDKEYTPSADAILLDRAQAHVEGDIDVTDLIEKLDESEIDAEEYLQIVNDEATGDVGLEAFKISKSWMSIVPNIYTNFLSESCHGGFNTFNFDNVNIIDKISEIVKDDEGWELLSTCNVENVRMPSINILKDELPEMYQLLIDARNGKLSEAMKIYSFSAEDHSIDEFNEMVEEFMLSLPPNIKTLSKAYDLDMYGPNSTSVGATSTREDFIDALNSVRNIMERLIEGKEETVLFMMGVVTNCAHLGFKIIDLGRRSDMDSPNDLLKLNNIANYLETITQIPEIITIACINFNNYLVALLNNYQRIAKK